MKYDPNDLSSFVAYQLKHFFPPESSDISLNVYIPEAIQRTDACLSASADFHPNLDRPFSPYHSVQYSVFLYWLSRVMWEYDQHGKNAEKIYYLNRILNSVDLFYEVELPHIWMCEHPLGSIMGRAQYSDHFFFYQGCTVGGNHGLYPHIGKFVVMYSNSKILGNSKIGSHVLVSANTFIKDEDIPDHSIVFGQSPNLIIKKKSQQEIEKLACDIWPS